MSSNLKEFTADKAKILIIDSNTELLNEEEKLMKIYNMDISTASTYNEGINMITQTKFDIIFIDPMFSGINDTEAALKIRKLDGEYYKNVVIISMTSKNDKHSGINFLKNGFNDFLEKPLDSCILNKILRTYLPREYIEYKDISSDTIDIQSISMENVDIETAVKNCGNSIKNYISIIAVAYQDGVKKIDSLIEYVKKHDFENYIIEIPGIKTVAAIIGDIHLSEMVSLQEKAIKSGNIDFIFNNAPQLISEYKTLLENIRKVLPDNKGSNTVKITKKYNLIDISDLLDSLICAIDNFDLDYANEAIDHLLRYPLKKEYVLSLNNIKEMLNIFDYETSYENAKILKRYVLKNETP